MEHGSQSGGVNSGLTRDDWMKAMEDAGVDTGVGDPLAITTNEFAAMFKLSRAQAERRLRKLEEAGRAKRTRKLAPGGDGRLCWSVAFRLIDT